MGFFAVATSFLGPRSSRFFPKTEFFLRQRVINIAEFAGRDFFRIAARVRRRRHQFLNQVNRFPDFLANTLFYNPAD